MKRRFKVWFCDDEGWFALWYWTYQTASLAVNLADPLIVEGPFVGAVKER